MNKLLSKIINEKSITDEDAKQFWEEYKKFSDEDKDALRNYLLVKPTDLKTEDGEKKADFSRDRGFKVTKLFNARYSDPEIASIVSQFALSYQFLENNSREVFNNLFEVKIPNDDFFKQFSNLEIFFENCQNITLDEFQTNRATLAKNFSNLSKQYIYKNITKEIFGEHFGNHKTEKQFIKFTREVFTSDEILANAASKNISKEELENYMVFYLSNGRFFNYGDKSDKFQFKDNFKYFIKENSKTAIEELIKEKNSFEDDNYFYQKIADEILDNQVLKVEGLPDFMNESILKSVMDKVDKEKLFEIIEDFEDRKTNIVKNLFKLYNTQYEPAHLLIEKADFSTQMYEKLRGDITAGVEEIINIKDYPNKTPYKPFNSYEEYLTSIIQSKDTEQLQKEAERITKIFSQKMGINFEVKINLLNEIKPENGSVDPLAYYVHSSADNLIDSVIQKKVE